MKYVIFKHRHQYMPLVFPDHVTHSTVSILDAVPVSAGFVKVVGISVRVFGESESLNLKPHERDNEVLRQWLWNSSTASFLTFNFDE